MPNRTRPIYEAARLAAWIVGDIGRELRLARIEGGMTQAEVGRRIGTSKSRVSRVERGRIGTLSVDALARHAAAVGLKPSIKLYPLGRRLLDTPQLDLLARFRDRLHSSWTWETEVPMPISGDLRSGDCRIVIPGCSALVEAYSRFAECETQTRRARRKQRDLGTDRLILLLAATRANREALAEAMPVLAGSFTLDTKATMAALAVGKDPGADAIVLL